jgi:predicted Fe-Mo cluster-binding NifX family protein
MAKGDDRQQVIEEFEEAVNMAPKDLETDESKSVGQSDGESESKGHESGRRILEILRKKKSDYTGDDLAHMKKVTGYVHQH